MSTFLHDSKVDYIRRSIAREWILGHWGTEDKCVVKKIESWIKDAERTYIEDKNGWSVQKKYVEEIWHRERINRD